MSSVRLGGFAGCAALLLAIVALLGVPATAWADDTVRVHVLPFSYNDAIIVECDGKFGMIDAGEDSDYPTGEDPRYPLRSGVVTSAGIEEEVADYLRALGVTEDNFEFFIGTHPHSDHIGGADEVIYDFHPKNIYTPYYDDSLITDPDFLFDSQYVYDHLVEAARWASGPEGYGATFVQYLGDEFDPPDADPSLVGEPEFYLGSARVEIMNYSTRYRETGVPDANYFSYGVLVEAANGRRAFFAGDINNYADGELPVGDEETLAQQLSDIDLLKMGHHGGGSSSSASFLRAVLSPVRGDVRPVAIQTGEFGTMPWRTINLLNDLGVRHFTASSARYLGFNAFVATLGSDKVRTNLDATRTVVQVHHLTPYALIYQGGLPMKGTGWHATAAGAWRLFDEDGALRTGWLSQEGRTYYLAENGSKVSGWRKIDGCWYYFSPQDRSMQVGWVRVDGRWYYLAPEDGTMCVGWQLIGGRWYYFNEAGVMLTGWVKLQGSWYYLDSSGAMATGWQKLQGNWYYLKGSGTMATGWTKVSGCWYYLKPQSGVMAQGWLRDGSWYYLTPGTGAMATGWVRIGASWYYLDASGVMATGTRIIDGVTYSFNSAGAMM